MSDELLDLTSDDTAGARIALLAAVQSACEYIDALERRVAELEADR